MQNTKVISLRGKASGTVTLTRGKEGLGAVVSLRGGARAAAAFFIESGSGRIVACGVDGDGGCAVAAGDVCAAAIFDGAAGLICTGAYGACGTLLAARLDEIRIRAASLLRGGGDRAEKAEADSSLAPPDMTVAPVSTAERPRGEESGTPPPHSSPHFEEKAFSPPVSAAARSILGMARELFAPLDGAGASAGQTGSGEGGAFETVQNPFPRSFPDSDWRRLSGEELLHGTVRTRRGIIKLTARPEKRGARRMAGERYFIDVSGKGYYVKEVRDGQKA